MKKIFLALCIIFCLTSQARAEIYLDAVRLYNRHEFAQAVNLFEKLIAENSILSDYAQIYIARALEFQKDFERTLLNYQKVLDNYPASVLTTEATLKMADIFYQKGQTRAALDYYEMVKAEPAAKFGMGLASGDLSYFYDLIVNHPDSESAAKARQEYARVKKLVLAPPDLFKRGNYYFDKKQYTEAASDFHFFASHYPRHELIDDVYLMLGRCGLRRGKISAGLNYLDKCIAYAGDAADDAYYYKGMRHDQKSIQRKNYLEKLIQKYPESNLLDYACYYLGYYYEIKDEYKKAILNYERLVEKCPQSWLMDVTLWRLGKLYWGQELYEAAYADFKRLAQDFSKTEFAAGGLFWQAKIARKLDKNSEADDLLRLLAQKYPRTYYGYRARDILGLTAAGTEEEEASNLHVQKFSRLYALGLNQAALAEVEAAGWQGWVALAKVHFARGDYPESINLVEGNYKTLAHSGGSENLDSELLKLSFPTAYAEPIFEYSQKFGVDPYLMFALIREESRFKQKALSYARAHGLTQIIPSTGRKIARQMNLRGYRTYMLYRPETSIKMGAFHLADLLQGFKGNKILALAAYNAGSHNVWKWVKKFGYTDDDEFVENIPFRQTRNYVKKVLNSYYEYKSIYIDDTLESSVY